MKYADVILFSGTWGLLFLFVMFMVAVVYALWPNNSSKFDHAAMMPLDDNDSLEGGDK